MNANTRPFGRTKAGEEVLAVRLASEKLEATILTFGAALQDVRLPGVPQALTLGGPGFAAYEGPMTYFGTIVGPVANRIGQAEAKIAGRLYRFPANEGSTLLHSGDTGIHSRVWTLQSATANRVLLTLVLEDGEGGFPGRRKLSAEYTVTGARLSLHLSATTDAPTLMNLAQHGYWNLTGAPTIFGQKLTVLADRVLRTTEQTLPTGEVMPVSGVFDLRRGRVIDGTEGFDHNFCLAPGSRPLTDAAVLEGGGLRMTIATTEPGLQVYDGRRLETAPFVGHGGQLYHAYAGLALEPQGWPDAPNHAGFPPITLDPPDTYTQITEWRFERG
jgi:aldose 1-epimerase